MFRWQISFILRCDVLSVELSESISQLSSWCYCKNISREASPWPEETTWSSWFITTSAKVKQVLFFLLYDILQSYFFWPRTKSYLINPWINLLLHHFSYIYSKKQKISGAFSDQNIEQLNDVTAFGEFNFQVWFFPWASLQLCLLSYYLLNIKRRSKFQIGKLTKFWHSPKNRKRWSNYFLAEKIVEFQKQQEVLCMKKKKEGSCWKLLCIKNWLKLVNTCWFRTSCNFSNILLLFCCAMFNLVFIYSSFCLLLLVAKHGLKYISNDVERCLSLVKF